MRRSVERGVLGASYSPKKAKSILKGRTVAETLLHGALARVALGSVPGPWSSAECWWPRRSTIAAAPAGARRGRRAVAGHGRGRGGRINRIVIASAAKQSRAA
ncbi:hypothetical protein ACFSLT_02225 [Novosphingobium resinovorum]